MTSNRIIHAIKSRRGSAMVISLGITAILLIIASTVSAAALMTFKGARDISSANQAFYAAEAGVEEALYQLAGHKAGFANSKTTDLNSSSYKWTISSRLRSLPLPGQGTSSDPNYNILPRNSKLVINLFNDISCDGASGPDCGLAAPSSQGGYQTKNASGFDLQLYKLDDGIDLGTVLVGDTRVTEIRADRDLYQEDSLAVAGDFDVGIAVNKYPLHFVDFNHNGLWDPGEPVYVDKDSNQVVSAGDIRLNTVAPNFRTCRQAYQPRRKPRDLAQVRVSTGHCDSNTAMANIDNDGDRRQGGPDEDPVDGIDNDGDNLVDEDPGFWPLTAADFYIPSQQSPSGANAFEQANIDVYADSPAVSWALSGKKLVNGAYEEVVEKSYYLLKSQLQATTAPGISLRGMNFPDPATKDFVKTSDLSNAIDKISEARLTIFSPLSGINYHIELLDQNSANELAKDITVIDATGSAGQSRQYLRTQVQQVESVPIFNFTITF